MVRFHANRVDWSDDFGCIVVTLDESGAGAEYLMFQREQASDANDDVYLECRGQGWSACGGILKCALHRNSLPLVVTEATAAQLSGESEFEVTFELPSTRFRSLQSRLRKIFRGMAYASLSFLEQRRWSMPGRTILETERLSLRQFIPEDAAAVFELDSDPLVRRYTGDAPFTSSEQVRTMLLERPIADYSKYGFGRWAVVSKADGEMLGMAGLKFLPELQAVDLGFRLLPRYWGLGLATEASLACLRYGWETIGLDRILGLVHPANERSIRVLTKCGLTFEKMIENESQPTALYAVHATGKRERSGNGHD